MSQHAREHPEDYVRRIEPETEAQREEGLRDQKAEAMRVIEAEMRHILPTFIVVCQKRGETRETAIRIASEVEQQLKDRWTPGGWTP